LSALSSTVRETVSIIIPALNESGQLPACLAATGPARQDVGVWVVDGGSLDDTVRIARLHGARVLASPVAQRASQMNLGADEAGGDVLLFLHADTLLPANWLDVLLETLARSPQVVGGGFRRRFAHPSFFLRITCVLADWRGHRCGWLLGDQAMFVRRDTFVRAGGFPSMKQFEDLELSLRLRRHGRMVLAPATVISSGRRFETRGPVRQTMEDFLLTLRFLLLRKRNHAVIGE